MKSVVVEIDVTDQSEVIEARFKLLIDGQDPVEGTAPVVCQYDKETGEPLLEGA